MRKDNKDKKKKDSYESYKHNAKLLLQLHRKVSFHVEDRIQMKDEEVFASRRQHLKDLVISFLEVDHTVNVSKLEESLIDINISMSLLELMDLALERLSRYPNNGELFSDFYGIAIFRKKQGHVNNFYTFIT